MSMSATPERMARPRPVFETLPAAVRAAISHGNAFQDINASRWSETYGHCGVEKVKDTWERIQWEMSQQPSSDDGEFAK